MTPELAENQPPPNPHTHKPHSCGGCDARWSGLNIAALSASRT